MDAEQTRVEVGAQVRGRTRVDVLTVLRHANLPAHERTQVLEQVASAVAGDQAEKLGGARRLTHAAEQLREYPRIGALWRRSEVLADLAARFVHPSVRP